MNSFSGDNQSPNPGRQLKEFLLNGTYLSRLLLINISIWFVISFIRVLFTLAGQPEDFFLTEVIYKYLGAPSAPGLLTVYFYTILTYNFVHVEFFHLLFNMLWLYWMGRIFTEYLSQKQLLLVYLLGGVSGFVVYLAAFNFFPGFLPIAAYSRLIGASASVMAVVTAIAFHTPHYTINLLFFGRIRLVYLAIGLFIIDFLMISSNNPGGHLAHIGGGLFGYFYSNGLRKNWFSKIRLPHFGRRSRLKTTYRSGSIRSDEAYNRQKHLQQEEIDRILDKIKHSGYQSLSASEKETLFKASRK
jgi:membrane associated rhomboid family serine protease